jgi:soluble lytic murein transglycosylase-like protein
MVDAAVDTSNANRTRLVSTASFSARTLLGGFVLLALGGAGAIAQGQLSPTSKDYVRRIAQQTRAEAPAPAIRERLQRYGRYIQYFTGLVYTRAGVTVDPDFVRALIAAESSARPRVVSDEGAIGLLQIRLETGRRAAQKLYSTGYNFRHVDRDRLQSLDAQDLKDPAVNILIGSYLLDRYNAAFGGHLARTIGAWNAGPDRVRQYEGTPPYQETLGLIARVNAFYLFFRTSEDVGQ